MFGDLFSFPKANKYSLSAKLQGHERPINCLAFSPAADLLASGGDDEEVRIWDLATMSYFQTLSDQAGNWGQVTCLVFMDCGAGAGSADWLCIGTGRGHIIVYRRQRKTMTFTEISSTRAFSAGDSIESIAFDAKNLRLAASSHYGRFKMFKYSLGQLTESWVVENNDYIPRAVRFSDNGENAIVYGLENGIVSCRDAQTSTEKYTKSLKTSIGNVGECPTTGYIIVDNMEDGFDLYAPSRASPTMQFKVPTTRRFVKKAVFGERGRVIACGSDHGLVYLFSPEDINLIQILRHGEDSELIQVVEAATSDGHHIVATASAGPQFLICLWKQPIKKARVAPAKRKQNKAAQGSLLLRMIITMNIMLFVAIIMWAISSSLSLPFTKPSVQSASSTLSGVLRSIQDVVQPSVSHKRQITIPDPPSLAELLIDLDDDSLRKILGLPKKLTEEYLSPISDAPELDDEEEESDDKEEESDDKEEGSEN